MTSDTNQRSITECKHSRQIYPDLYTPGRYSIPLVIVIDYSYYSYYSYYCYYLIIRFRNIIWKIIDWSFLLKVFDLLVIKWSFGGSLGERILYFWTYQNPQPCGCVHVRDFSWKNQWKNLFHSCLNRILNFKFWENKNKVSSMSNEIDLWLVEEWTY